MDPISHSADRILRPEEVAQQTSLSLSTLRRMVQRGEFPKPRQLSPRRIGWGATDVGRWLSERNGVAA